MVRHLGRADEIGQLANGFKEMRQQLHSLLANVQDQAQQVAAASEELTASSEQSAQASNQVAESITNIAGGVEDQATASQDIQESAAGVTQQSKDVGAQTAHIVASAQGVKDQVTSGRNSINEAVEQMQQITKSTESIQASIGKLSESGKKISQMVANNHTDMEATVTACNEGAESIRAGIQTVHDADDVFEKMVTTIDELVVGINAVADAIRQMETQNESMLTASQNISATGRKNSDEAQSVSAATEEQTASMHEIATASGSLAKLAANLQAEIEKFRL